MSCLSVAERIFTQHGAISNDQLASDVVGIKKQLYEGLKYYNRDSSPASNTNDQQKAFISKLSGFLLTSPHVSELMYKEYLQKTESQGSMVKASLYNVAKSQQIMEEVRKVYWNERLSLIQLQKIMSSHWDVSWFQFSDLLYGVTDYKSYADFTKTLIQQFSDLYKSFIDLLSKNFASKVQIELSIDIKLLQFLREIKLTLEALLISLSGGIDSYNAPDSENVFSTLLEAFWESLFFSRKELICLSAACRKIVDKLRNLQCFILIKACHLDNAQLFESKNGQKDHFLTKFCSRILASVSSLNRYKGNAPLLLFAAVCGSAFASSPDELAKSNDYAIMAIQDLGVFNYLCEILQESSSTPFNSVSSNSDLLTIPESLSIVGFCSHLAIFDLLTLLAQQVALDSLDKHRSAYTRVLAKTLSVLVQCNANMSVKDSQQSRIGQRIAPVIEDLAQRFPLDLDLLFICVALLNTSLRSSSAIKEAQSVPNLVVQLISNVPYFAEHCNPTGLKDLIRLQNPAEAKGSEEAEVIVSLLRQHWALPPYASSQIDQFPRSASSSPNPFAIFMPESTRGMLKQDGIIVWQHEYSIWPVLNAIVVSAEHILSLNSEDDQYDSDDSRPVSMAISRLVSCLEFIDACLLVKIEPIRCLAITELLWGLLTRIFTESLSGERETPLGRKLTSMSADHLLFCLLRLTAHSAMCVSDSNLIHKLSNGVFRCLQEDRIICPSVVLQPIEDNRQTASLPKYNLTDSCLLRIINSTSSSASLWTADISPSTAYSLISVYLDLALALLAAEKAAFLSDAESCFSDGFDEESNASPLAACLFFCYELLVEAGGIGGSRTNLRCLNIIWKLVTGSSDCKSHILHLVNKALLFFVELLTSYSLEDDCNTTRDFIPTSWNISLIRFRDLRYYALCLLINSEAVLNCLISLTKVSVEALQIPLQSADFDFLRFSTLPDEEQIGGVSALGQYRVQSTWLAITLLHSIFPDHSTPSGGLEILLKSLSTSDATCNAFFLHLIGFLDPACPIGLTRAAVSLLKKLIRFSDRLITPHFHDMSPRLLNFLINRLRSSTTDQVTRTGLLDFLSEAVIHDVLNGSACPPFNGAGFGLLRMISSNPNEGTLNNLEGIVIAALQEVKKELNSSQLNLYWALLKLLSAIWIQPCNPFRIQLYEAPEFWESLNEPFHNHMARLKDSKIVHSVVDLEIAGSFASIISVELFELLKSASISDEHVDKFLNVCNKFVEDVLVPWLQVAFPSTDNLESLDSIMETLNWAVIRWKSVFCTLLKWNTSVRINKSKLLSNNHVIGLVDACLNKASIWVSLPRSHASSSIIDQLSVCLAASARYLVDSTLDVESLPIHQWLEQAVTLLEHRFASPTRRASINMAYGHFQADLLAFITLLLPKSTQVSTDLYDRLLSLGLEVIQDVSLLSRISSIESEAFIQALNVLQSIWNQFSPVKLANCLIDAGIINNLIAILTENSRTFKNAEFCQAIVRLLIRLLLSSSENNHGTNVRPSKLSQVLTSYASSLIEALRLPPTDHLMRWLLQADDYKPTSEVSHEDLFPNTTWSNFLLTQLRFIKLLVVQQGGAGEFTPTAHLLKTFLLSNHEQLFALLSAAPSRGLLIASAIFDLYWCAIHSSPSATKLISPTCVASTALFVNGYRDERPPINSASICLPSDVRNSVYSTTLQITRNCAILLLRPGISEVSTAKSSLEPGKSSKHFVNLKLLPILRLLCNCLRLIVIETPSLGELSFASASEIAALTPDAALNFATPSAEDCNNLTFGLLFSIARTSSQLIVDIHTSKYLSTESEDPRRCELLSLLVQVNELVFSLIYSQATIWLMNPLIDIGDKHTLSRGLAVEFQSYNFLGRSTRRGMRTRSVQTPSNIASTTTGPAKHTPDSSDSPDSSGQQLSEYLTFLNFTERFSDFVK